MTSHSLTSLLQQRSSTPTAAEVRRTLPKKFRKVRLLGKSSHSLVFGAFDAELFGARTAIKVYLENADTLSPRRQRFLREIEILAAFDHPHIVKVFDLIDGPRPAFSMEYLSSVNLKEVLETGVELPVDQVLRLMLQICDAAQYAHERGVIHRDLKPANVMLDNQHNAKLIDFGTALRPEQERLTEAGRTLGTPLYMAPEQFLRSLVDARADVYSLGALFFHLLTGAPPFLSPEEHLTEPVPALEYSRGFPTAFSRILRRALAKAPSDRYSSASEFAAELRSAS